MNTCAKAPGETLCWRCANTFAGGCPWFTDFTPVPGWRAVEGVVRVPRADGAVLQERSYTVVFCPKFLQQGRAGARRGGRA